MISSWSVEVNNAEDESSLNDVINTGFYTDNKNRKKDKQTIKETQEHMWLFNGMAGFKKNRK